MAVAITNQNKVVKSKNNSPLPSNNKSQCKHVSHWSYLRKLRDKSRLDPNGTFISWSACYPAPSFLGSAVVQGELLCRLLMQLFV